MNTASRSSTASTRHNPPQQQRSLPLPAPASGHAGRRKRSKSPHVRKENLIASAATLPPVREEKRRKPVHSAITDGKAHHAKNIGRLPVAFSENDEERRPSGNRGRSNSHSRSRSQERRRSNSRKRGIESANGAALANVVLAVQRSQPISASAVSLKSQGERVSEKMRLREELKACQMQLTQLKRAAENQERMIQELKVKGKQAVKAITEKDEKIAKLMEAQTNSDKMAKNIEQQLTCQVCLEILVKPQGLSCGHVLCQSCLQSWFTAPKADENDMDEDFPDNALYRRKTCPCCRATIRERPKPLFALKAIAQCLPNAPPRQATPPPNEDPWIGIFPDFDSGDEEDWDGYDAYGFDDGEMFGGTFSSDEMDEDDGEDDEEEDEVASGLHAEDGSDYAHAPSDNDSDISVGYDSLVEDVIEEDPYTGRYVPPSWEPPATSLGPDFTVNDDDSRATDADLRMLRRGATLDMIDAFEMMYSHSRGLVVSVGRDTLYPGWNIHLDEDDEDGGDFVDWCLRDAHVNPHRWLVADRQRGRSFRRLIPIHETVVYDDSTTEYDF